MDTGADLRRPRILEDPTGRRLRRLRWVGRGVAVIFFLWLAVVGLGSLGAGPTERGLDGKSHVHAPAHEAVPVGEAVVAELAQGSRKLHPHAP